VSASSPESTPPAPGDEPTVTPADTQALRADEFYFEGPYMVFTEAYHRRRGYCCNSDCRHCPYR